MLQTLLNQLSGMSIWDWTATLCSLAYVILAARDNDWCWVFAAVSTAIWAYLSITVYHLISDGLLQVFYMVMAGVGLRRWQRERREGTPEVAPALTDSLDGGLVERRKQPSIRRMTLAQHALVIVGSLVGGHLLYLAVSGVMEAASAIPDAITTVASVITTFLLIGRRLENWLYWIVIDAAYVVIYYQNGAVLFAALMVLNIVFAAYGFWSWSRIRAANTA